MRQRDASSKYRTPYDIFLFRLRTNLNRPRRHRLTMLSLSSLTSTEHSSYFLSLWTQIASASWEKGNKLETRELPIPRTRNNHSSAKIFMLMYLYRPPRADCPDYNETILHLQVLSILSTIFLKDTTQCHSSQKKLLTDVTSSLVHQHRLFDSNYLALQNCDWCARITIPIKGLLQALTFLLPTSIDQPFYVVTIPSFPLLFLAARKPQIDLLVQPSPNHQSTLRLDRKSVV